LDIKLVAMDSNIAKIGQFQSSASETSTADSSPRSEIIHSPDIRVADWLHETWPLPVRGTFIHFSDKKHLELLRVRSKSEPKLHLGYTPHADVSTPEPSPRFLDMHQQVHGGLRSCEHINHFHNEKDGSEPYCKMEMETIDKACTNNAPSVSGGHYPQDDKKGRKKLGRRERANSSEEELRECLPRNLEDAEVRQQIKAFVDQCDASELQALADVVSWKWILTEHLVKVSVPGKGRKPGDQACAE